MNVEMNKLDEVNATIVVTLEEKDYANKVKKALNEIGQHRSEPGFRPGHVPAGLLRKKYGKAVKYDVINKEVADAIYEYIESRHIQVLGNPMPVKDENFDIEAADFTFQFRVGLAPEIDAHINKEMHIPYYTIEITDEMIKNQDEMLRRRYGQQVPGEEVEPNALVKGVITELGADGQPLEGGIVVENGILSPQYFKSEEQRKLFEGKKVGDTVRFNPAATCDGNETELSSMLNIPKDETALHHGDFDIKITEIIVLKPAEDTQEFFDQAFGPDKVHNAEEYREAVKALIARQLEADSNYRFTVDGEDVILKAVGEVQLPDQILKDYLITQNENLNAENIDAEYDKIRPGLVWQIVREQVARHFHVEVSKEDMLALAKAAAQNQFAQYGMTGIPDEALTKYATDMLGNEKTREQIAAQAFESGMWAAVKDNVTLDEKTVSVQEFNDLFKDNK